jgi:hypothetical protein
MKKVIIKGKERRKEDRKNEKISGDAVEYGSFS